MFLVLKKNHYNERKIKDTKIQIQLNAKFVRFQFSWMKEMNTLLKKKIILKMSRNEKKKNYFNNSELKFDTVASWPSISFKED